MPEPTDTTTRITTPEQLRELLGSPGERVRRKVRPELHPRQQEWIASSPLCLVATAAADGSCDVSPKGDPPGMFVSPDPRTVVIPERPGNRRADGFLNILQNPHVGLIFLIPGRPQTLRVNGTAVLETAGPYVDGLSHRGHRPRLCTVVTVQEAFFHCGKAFLRSSTWQPDTWEPDRLPSHAQLVKETEALPTPLEELEEYYGPSYAQLLYAERPSV